MNNQYRIEALWWSYLIFNESPYDCSRARALVVTQLAEYGVIP